RDDGEVSARLKARKPPRRTAFSMFHRDGGLTGNRTRVQGFAVLCVTTPPSGRGPRFQGPRHREGRQLSDRIVRCNARTYKRVTFLRLADLKDFGLWISPP